MTVRASCGLTFACPADLPSAVTVTTQSGYDFLCIPIVHPRYRIPEKSDSPSDSAEKVSTRERKPLQTFVTITNNLLDQIQENLS